MLHLFICAKRNIKIMYRHLLHTCTHVATQTLIDFLNFRAMVKVDYKSKPNHIKFIIKKLYMYIILL